MSKDTGKELPWGNLTGIRPAKIPGMLFEQGMREEQVRKTMKETYLISDEKLNLAIDISRRKAEYYQILIIKKDTVFMLEFLLPNYMPLLFVYILSYINVQG